MLVESFNIKMMHEDINGAIMEFEKLFTYAASDMLQYQNERCAVRNAPWWSHECTVLKNQKYKALILFRRCTSDDTLKNYLYIRNFLRNVKV